MTGEKLTAFCCAICDAIAIGADLLSFDGGSYSVSRAIDLADDWITEEGEDESRLGWS